MNSNDFINSIKKKAQEDMAKYGILASLTISQAIVESSWGESELSKTANNIFGIKADGTWQGDKVLMSTREYRDDGSSYNTKAWFRKYRILDEAIQDHTILLTNSRYKNLIGVKDYKTAARLVREDGYATDPQYTNLLINIIEKYKLYQYDSINHEDSESNADESIKDLQEKLNILKIRDAKGNNLEVDGKYGPLTKSAVSSFQSIMGLYTAGTMGPAANAAMKEIFTMPVLREGKQGYAVRYVQWRVGAEVDGRFGPITKSKVSAFQNSVKAMVDGVVGPETWGKLLMK